MTTTQSSFKVKIQKFGAFLTAMVMPNIPAFIAWGILTALFIPTGWMPNENLNQLVGPTLTYLMPILIGYTGGYNIYGKRGGVAGAIATIGVVIGADITMLIGGMIMGPLGGFLIKKLDAMLEGHIRPGLEMLVNNFTLGILGGIIMIVGFLIVTPIFDVVLSTLATGVEWTIDKGLLPFTSIFVQPAQVLFLNNAINHGIMIPLGVEQAAELGKSVLFLVEANGGIWAGLLLAYCIFAKGDEKSSAISALPIMVFGGIGEVAFPYALMRPITLLGPIAGNIVALFILQLMNGGTVAAVSPGSVIALILMSPKGAYLTNLLAYFVGAAVSCAIAGFFLVKENKKKQVEVVVGIKQEESVEHIESTINTAELGNLEGLKMLGTFPISVKKIIIACDAGMGSSAMGTSLLQNAANKAMLDVVVKHNAVHEIDPEADLIVTTKMLFDRACDQRPNKNVPVISLDNLMDKDAYQTIVDAIRRLS